MLIKFAKDYKPEDGSNFIPADFSGIQLNIINDVGDYNFGETSENVLDALNKFFSSDGMKKQVENFGEDLQGANKFKIEVIETLQYAATALSNAPTQQQKLGPGNGGKI